MLKSIYPIPRTSRCLAVSKSMRDAVDASGRKMEGSENEAVSRGYLSTLVCCVDEVS